MKQTTQKTKTKTTTELNDEESEDTQESVCSWDSDEELEKEIADLFLKDDKIKKPSFERISPEGAEVELSADPGLCKAYIIWLISCKERCTCGAFMENPYGRDRGMIETELLRNAEIYVKKLFPYKREYGFRVQISGREESLQPLVVNGTVSEDNKKRNKLRQESSTSDDTDEAIVSVKIAQLAISTDTNATVKKMKTQEDCGDLVEVTGSKTTEGREKAAKKRKNIKKRKKVTTRDNLNNPSESIEVNYDSRLPDEKHSYAFVKQQDKIKRKSSTEDESNAMNTSSDVQDIVVPLEVTQFNSGQEHDRYLAGRSNPVGKKHHVDYVIDSDNEENLVVVRSSTAEYPKKERPMGNPNKVLGLATSERAEHSMMVKPKTSASFERSKSLPEKEAYR